MIDNHLITPPPELVQQWFDETDGILEEFAQGIATRAARWGADQELKACYEWIVRDWTDIQSADMLLDARRPKPPSLKAGAIEVLDELDGLFELPAGHYNTILRALESLSD